ncbi:E3 ubiquitin-protein ligase TRIM71-like [Crassostrea angulata]|uniref:E3 ubiquitin-protein ligase TRIM71-like n=1 Tax=Magallana angulata TaxID=2784310 RepID=UPI0022B0F040|nr:E3 ubiquitin-protein ligase TRIM71-like [Crassostrea angulata]XP_052682115.1 E3 ubiquitin-protein ligase TRIM71-like [Crassostrea angulata]
MAYSKSQVPDTAQHYLVCGIKDCEKNCLFYCNPCHQPMCEQCRDEHQKSPETKNHELVPYRHRKDHLPVEKCRDHPTKDLDILCDQCSVPLCSKCSTMTVHKGHSFTDLETIYTENSAACRQEIQNIQAYFIPMAKDLQNEIKLDATNIKTIMDGIRSSMMDEAKSLKTLVDEVTSDNIEQVNKMEESLKEMLQSQDITYEDYISYLKDLVNQFYGYLSSTQFQNNAIIFPLSEYFKIRPIPETTKPVPPVFTAGRYSKEMVAKLLGKITVSKTKPENRKVKAMETASKHLKHTRLQGREKYGVKQRLSSSVTKVREYTVPGVDSVHHISQGKSSSLWVSDNCSHIVHTDLQGNQLQNIKTSGGRYVGNLTVTQEGDLIYADKQNKVINRITPDKTITEFIKTGDWTPLSIHSSHINGDILVGMIKEAKGKVTRYNKTGKEIQNIESDNKGQELYSYPHYITENINGDICTSDLIKQAVVVVNKSGQHRFSYTGQGSEFYPRGVCTDRLGHILVCDICSNTVHLLDQVGQFLCLLLKQQEGAWSPCNVCVDGENNLFVGHWKTNTVTVYKYLQ